MSVYYSGMVAALVKPGKDRRGMSVDEMLTKGMVLGVDGFWRGAAMPDSVLAKKGVE